MTNSRDTSDSIAGEHLQRTQQHGEAEQPVVKVGSSAAIAAIAPQLLGFRPNESLVMTFFNSDRRLQLVARIDLPIPPGEELAAVGPLFDQAVAGGFAAVHLAAVTASKQLAPDQMSLIASGFEDLGVWVMGCGAVWDDRWWPMNPNGLFDEVGESLRGGPALRSVSELVLRGRACAADRDELVERVRGEDPDMRGRVAWALNTKASRLWAHGEGDGDAGGGARLKVENALVAFLTGARDRPTPREAAKWIRALADSRVREPMLWRLSPAPGEVVTDDRAVTALAWLLRACPPEWAAPVAASVAALAWQGGDGVLASIASDYACECDPGNRLGGLIQAAVLQGTHPSVWTDLMRSMTLPGLRGDLHGAGDDVHVDSAPGWVN